MRREEGGRGRERREEAGNDERTILKADWLRCSLMTLTGPSKCAAVE